MSNGLTISYPYQRQALTPSTMMLLVLGLLLVHLVIFRLSSIAPPPFERPVVERQLRLSLAPVVVNLPELDAPVAKMPEPSAPEVKPPDVTAVKTLAAPEETRKPEPAAPPAAPEEKQPTPEQETATAPKSSEPNLSPLMNVRVADDTAAGQEKPPVDAQYEGATNTVAADRSTKEKIGPDPKVDGESGEVRFAGRRGETENKEAKRDDPAAGSVEKEGAPEPGKPPEPQVQVAKLPEPEPAKVFEPVAQPKPEDVNPETAEPAGRPDEIAKKATAPEPEPEGFDPLKQMTPILEPTRQTEFPTEKPLAAKSDREPMEPKDELRKPAPVMAEPEVAQARKPVAASMDPELARLQRILEKPQAAPDTALTNPGAGTREGRVGHEGDGKVREGELNAVSDVISATMTSAAEYGDVAFSKRATPENAYLKPYFRRMDAKWKAVFFAGGRALSHLEFGTVEVRFTLDKNGKLVEVAEVSRTGTVSDTAVRACLEGLRRAAPHDAFPPALSGREKLTETIVFLYR
jgi:outer membrane biosynthesis protein TonB